MTDSPTTGIDISGPNGEKAAFSIQAVDHILALIERMWGRFLDWGHDNPLLFICFLIFLLIAFWIWQRARVDISKMKQDYSDARSNAKTQLALPLPANDQPRL
ncbi:MAG: hypothetical protein WAU63_07635, partial [Methylovirgula sp.]